MYKQFMKIVLPLIVIIILWNLWISNDTLLLFLIGSMIIDYILGIYIAGYLKKSNHTNDGKLSSKVSYIGIMKKVGILIMVWIGYEIDLNFQLTICRNMLIVGYLINEIISIEENLTLIGIQKNYAIKKVISILQNILDEGEKNEKRN